MVMDRVTVGVLLLAFCKGAWAQTSGGNSNLSLWNSGSGFGGGVTSMMMIIGLGLICATISVLVVTGIITRLMRRAHARDGHAAAAVQDAGAHMRAAEEGLGLPAVAQPVPFLVMQPNGKDIACAYVVDDDDTDKGKAQAAAGAPATGVASVARGARAASSQGMPPTYHVSNSY